MGITAPLRARPFYTGSSSGSELVPYRFPISLDGRPYMLDTAMTEAWGHETVPLLRPQADQSAEPGEQSLNPESLVRRSWTSWHKGAGQRSRDREDSVRARFRASAGVDVWTRDQITLLNAIDQKRTTSNTNLKLMPCGDRLFLIDGAACVYTTDITAGTPTWSDTSNEPGGTIVDIASDGRYVWITDGTDIYQADGTATPPDFTVTAWEATDADVLAYVKGYLLSAHEDDLNYHAADGTATAVTLATGAVVSGGFTFVGFCGGPANSVIYAAGFAGDKSLIFRIGIEDDGSGLDVAIPAGELPDGEIVRAIGSYLGFVLIGTDEGVRFATPDANGDLTIGALLETGSPCRCFEGQGQFVWFGWDAYTETVLSPEAILGGVALAGLSWTGLGRLSLEEFSSAEKLAPAYATDLMQVAAGVTSSVVSFGGRRVWCSEGTGRGVFAEEGAPGTSAGNGGYLVSSLTDFGFTGNKTAVSVDVGYVNPSGGQIVVQVEEDDSGALSTVGQVSSESQGVASFGAGFMTGARFQVVVAMAPSGNVSPTVRRVSLGVSPSVRSGKRFSLPLVFQEWVDVDGGVYHFDVDEEINAVEGWNHTRQPITLRSFARTYTVTVEDHRWVPRMVEDGRDGFREEGTMIVVCKEIAA